MSPKEAIDIVRTASGLAPLNRNDHTRILQALEVLEKIVNEESKNG
jgi:hemerythrin-like domain-containing protein